MASIGSLVATLGVDTKDLDKAEKEVRSFESKSSASFKRIGQVAAGAFSVIAIKSFIQKASSAYEVQRQAEAKLKAVIESTGGAAGKTTDELLKQASALQQMTNYGDETIISMQAVIATFKQIKGDEFDRTAKAALDMATIMGTDLTSSAIQLAKALNDPIANLGALGRAGVQFTKTQKETIKALWEGGRQADAQRIILAELESQFGGASKAVVDWKIQLVNAWGDVIEKTGKFVNEALKPLGIQLLSMANYINDNASTIKSILVPAIDSAVYALKLFTIHLGIKGISLLSSYLTSAATSMLTLRTATLAASQAGQLLGRVFLYGVILEGIAMAIDKWREFNKLVEETPATWGTVGRIAADQFVNAVLNGIIALGNGINNVIRVVTDPLVDAFWVVGQSIPDLLFGQTTFEAVASKVGEVTKTAFQTALKRVGDDFSADMNRRLVKIASDADLALLSRLTTETPTTAIQALPTTTTSFAMPELPVDTSKFDDLINQLKFEQDLIGQTETAQKAMTLARQNDIAIGTQQYQTILNLVEANEKLARSYELEQEFKKEMMEFGKSQFDIERDQILERMELYRQAFEERKLQNDELVQLEQMTAYKLRQIASKEQEAKLSIYENMAGQIAGTFQSIAEAGGKQSKAAFMIYKAFAIAQAGIAGAMAYVKTLAEPNLPWPGNIAMANMIAGMTGVQIGMIAAAQPPSFDNGGITTKEGLYHAGNIDEAHIPLKGGRVPVDMGAMEERPEMPPVVLNISTFDAKSFKSFLRSNKSALSEVLREAHNLNYGIR